MKRFSSVVLLSVVLAFFAQAEAEDRYWIGASGSWDDPSHWNPNGQPQGEDSVYLTQNGSENISVGYSSTLTNDSSLKEVYVDSLGSGGMTLNVEGGILKSRIINLGYAGQGTIVQSGGKVSAFSDYLSIELKIGYAPGSSGTYILNAGDLIVGEKSFGEYIGSSTGTGTFLQTGGNHESNASPIVIGVKGTYNHTGGKLSTPSESDFIVEGTYNLSDQGVAELSYMYLRAGGVINQSGGKLSGNNYSHYIAGTYNLSGGSLRLSEADQIMSSGVFNQTGGQATIYKEFDFVNNGSINLDGGSLTVDKNLTNNGNLTYTGGELHLGNVSQKGTLTNNGTINLAKEGTRTIDGNVFNNGTFKTTHTTAVYSGTFTNNGVYISDPAVQYFNDLIIGKSGYLVGQKFDKFIISGDFINNSIMNMDWDTYKAYLGFKDGTDNLHDFYLTGQSFGATVSAYANNFSWGTLDITDDYLYLYDGNIEAGAALYLRELRGAKITGDLIIANLKGFDGLDIYYMPNLKENAYLNGSVYALTGGGHLRPAAVPEPAAILLLGGGLIGLAGYSMRKFKNN